MSLPIYFIDTKVLVTGGQGVNRLNSSFNLNQHIQRVMQDTSGLGSSVVLADGSAATPSLRWDSDTDTGFRWVSSGVTEYVANATGQIRFTDGTIQPVTTADIDLGTSSLFFKDGYFSGGFVFSKEANHTFTVVTSTTATVAGGNISLTAGTGATSGAGGLTTIAGGVGGATGTGGGLTLSSGAGGATSGNSGAVTVQSANETATDASGNVAVNTGTTASAASGTISIASGAVATSGNSGTVQFSSGASTTTGNSGTTTVSSGTVGTGDSGNVALTTGGSTVGGTGDITLTTGNTASGLAGDVILTTGTSTSATVCPVISMVNGVIRKPGSSTVASGATITGPELVRGLIAATGATGNWQLPSCANITTAIGSTPAGTNFEFVFNAAAMTATNTATLVVGASMTVASAAAITGGDALTVTQDTQVTAGFRVVYDTSTTCKIYRIW